jgi:hypothetical protein
MTDTGHHLSAVDIGVPPKVCHIVGITRVADGLSIDSELYDEGGNLVATIKNNEYRAIIGDSSYIEKDGNLSTLKVIGRTTWFRLWTTDHEMLFLKFSNPSTIIATGTWACPGHRPLIVTEAGQLAEA